MSPQTRNGHQPSAFVEPSVPAIRQSLTSCNSATVGIVQKYVNFGKGFRPRLFVLENGVLSYYKIYGPTAVNVSAIVNTLKQRNEVQCIGARTNLESNARLVPEPNNAPPQGELHLQVSYTRASEGDNKKFYVHSGSKVLTCKAETSEDCSAWMQALNTAQALWTIRQEVCATTPVTPENISDATELSSGLQNVLDRMAAGGATPTLISDVQTLFLTQQRVYQDFAAEEAQKRHVLLEYVKRLEADKRELETNMVVQAADERNRTALSITRNSTDGLDHEAEAHDSDAEVDDDEFRNAEEEFHECNSDEDIDELQSTRSITKSPSMSPAFRNGEPVSPFTPDQTMPRLSGATSLTNLALANSLAADSAASGASSQVAGVGSSNNLAALGDDEGIGPDLPKPDWLKQEASVQWRESLPPPQQQEQAVSLWQLIKGVVGKDLTRICLPVYFNEPLSALQKCCEDVEYSELLNKAARFPKHSHERLHLVTAFAISGYSGTLNRTCKPFNPLLGETFEFVHKEKGFRFLAEKVVHHPMIMACMCEGVGWSIAADVEMKSKFWGRSIEIHPAGVVELTFDDGEVYQWNKVITSINNIIIGRINVTHGGIMRVRSLTSTTNLMSKITFHEPSFLSNHLRHGVTGHVEDGGVRVPGVVFRGAWDDKLIIEVDGVERVLWIRTSQPPEPTRYNLTRFVIALNQLTDGLEKRIAPTDSRLRPDQKALEQGIYDVAFNEKVRLEERQRAARKAAENGIPLKPRWFNPVPDARQGHDVQFRYKGGYWETRAAGGPYTECRDIYGY